MDSYSQNPPNRNQYGDYTSSYGTLPPPAGPDVYGQQRIINQAPLQNAYGSPSVTQQQQQQQQPLQADLTPEDYLFLKKWKQDCLYQRSIPLMTLSCGAQFYYNKMKQLPHSWTRYATLVVTSYFVGIISYRNEFKRRIATSTLNTPFMQKARASLGMPASVAASQSGWSTPGGYETPMNAGPDAAIGLYSADAYSVNPPKSGGSGNMGLGYKEEMNADWTNDNTVNSPASIYATPSPVAPSNMEHFNPLPVNPGANRKINNPIENQPSGGLTYDEIRARNRGMLR